jgi:hypothetical protein
MNGTDLLQKKISPDDFHNKTIHPQLGRRRSH